MEPTMVAAWPAAAPQRSRIGQAHAGNRIARASYGFLIRARPLLTPFWRARLFSTPRIRIAKAGHVFISS
jgi:hypothetical protein